MAVNNPRRNPELWHPSTSIPVGDTKYEGQELEQDQEQEPRANSQNASRSSSWATARAALLDAIEFAPETKSEWGRFGKGLRELLDAGADADDIRQRAEVYRTRWPEMELTATALAANWSRLRPERQSPPRSVIDQMLAEELAKEAENEAR